MSSPEPQDPVALARAASATSETADRAIPLLDLTSLGGGESAGEIEALCRRALAAGVAAVCIFPDHLPLARALLADGPVRLATVANFPHGSDDLAGTADEVAAAVAEGAEEVDVVAPLAAIVDGDVGLVADLVEACRAVARPDTTLKLIIETGRLEDPALIAAASRAGVMAGVDFLKTSTGKIPIGATLEAVAVMLRVIAEADGRVGLKVAGGVRSAHEAARYLALADAMLGRHWVSPARFRIGASALLDALVTRSERG